jgi:hypothetical protein
MDMRILGLAVIASVALLMASGRQAAASTTCSGEYSAANGGQTLATATNIGMVAAGCEIGPFVGNAGTGNLSTTTFVNDSTTRSIYEFTWNGGALTIEEALGNNGIGNNVNVELGLLSAVTLNSNGSLSGTGVVSTSLPYASGPSGPYDIIDAVNLTAGTYVLDTYLGSCALESCSNSGTSTDPNYAVLFSPVATPLPAAFPLFATGFGALGLLEWRRKRKNAAALAAA